MIQYFWKLYSFIDYYKGFPGDSAVKILPAMQEMQVQSLEQEMTTHSSILAWEIPWTEEPGRLNSMGPQRVRHNLVTEHSLIHKIMGKIPCAIQ